jgi:hypothetical protein
VGLGLTIPDEKGVAMVIAVTRDVFILLGLVAAAGLGVVGAWMARLMFAKLGVVLCVAAVCVGLINSGWKPWLGGSYSERTYFGATMLLVGLLGLAIIGAIEESHRRLKSGVEPERGFPVMPPGPERPA